MALQSTNASLSALRPGEEGWQESELCHREMLRLLPVAVYTCDAEGRVTFFNRAAAQLWGREPVLRRDLWCGSWRILSADGAPMELSNCPMARTLREGRAIRGEQIMVERWDGKWSRVVAYHEPIFNSTGELVGAVNTLVDVTPERSDGHPAPGSSSNGILPKNLADL